MKRIAAISFLIFLSACTSKKVIKPVASAEKKDTTTCDNRVKLIDYTSNGNCGFIFQLDDGTKLLPSSMPEVDIPFIDNSFVFIAYKEYDKVKTKTSSLCGLEDKVVEITCIRKYEDPSNTSPKTHDDCQQVKNVFKNEWMREVTAKLKPQKIFEYDYAVGYIYLFNVNGINYLYDCLGNRMCDTNDNGDCNSLIETLGVGTLLQVMKN